MGPGGRRGLAGGSEMNEKGEIFQKISNILENLPEIQSLIGKFPEILAAAAFFFSVNIKRTGKSEIQFSEAHLIIV